MFRFLNIILIISIFSISFCSEKGADRGTEKKEVKTTLDIEQFMMDMGGVTPFTDQSIDFTLKNLDGETVKLSDYKGKVVFLNFWVTWCPICRAEMPAMEKLHQSLKDEDFVMLAVNFDQPNAESQSGAEDLQDTISTYAMMLDMTFPVLLDPTKQVTTLYEVKATPTTYIINKDGSIIGKFVSERHWDSEKSINFFKKLSSETIKPGV